MISFALLKAPDISAATSGIASCTPWTRYLPREMQTQCIKRRQSQKKKLGKGDGGWHQWKEVLGWILDTERKTLELTERCSNRILDIFEDLQGQNRVGVKKWQHVLGERRFMGPVVPGSAGLFGALQLGLSHSDKHCIKITRFLRDHLSDFETLARDVSL